MSAHASAVFEIKSWDEKPWLQLEGVSKLTRAAVTKVYRGDIVGEASSETLMYYLPDGTAVFNGFERIAGTIGGREGSFVLQATGTFKDSTATCELTVVPGSGTGQLTGLRGEARFAATHTDYPNVPLTMDYRFES